MLKSALSLLLFCATTIFAGAATTVAPTTTLTAETANNTSAAATFTSSSNGNPTAGNVSQESIHKALYAGANAKVYAHYMAWWGSTSHINIGYDSATLAQAHNAISDMMRRGIDGLIIDWYGAGNTHTDQASQYIKQDAETRGGKFTFAIMEDQGAVRTCAYTAGCDATQKVIDDLNYINTTYASSPAYQRMNGRPVIYTFDTENLPNIDWTKVMSSVQGNPMLVLRNDQGFRISYTSGSYSWVPINKANPDDWGQGYLDDFYTTSRSYSNQMVLTGLWKGFNDTLASWTQNRIVNQNCGQTWLNTIDEMNKYFSSTDQAYAVQLVTWNDYEEGTEIETGIDNCVSVSGSVSGSTLNWAISGGQENSIDHYTVFISLDGQNLMKLADVAAGTHQLALAGYAFAAANYTLYVKAVGKPSMLNKMSAAVPYTPPPSATPFVITGSAPSNNSTVGQLVHFAATTSSGSPVTALRIYVDNVSMYAVNASTLNTTLKLPIGAHYVVLQGWNQAGQIAKTPLNITVVNKAPTVKLAVTPSSGVGPLTANATASGTDPDGTIASTSIAFGDGTVASSPKAAHIYAVPGTYTVTATVKDNNGATATAKATVSVTSLTPGVFIQRPLPSSVQHNPVAITASAFGSGSRITSMRVSVDNVLKRSGSFSLSSSAIVQIGTSTQLAVALHHVLVEAWDANGKKYSSSALFQVQ